MNYLAHFTFKGNNNAQDGYFTMVVAADSPEHALNRFRSEIERLSKEDFFFQDKESIYLEDIIEMARIPRAAVLTRHESRSNDGRDRIATNLPGNARGMKILVCCDEEEAARFDPDLPSRPFLQLGCGRDTGAGT